MSFFGLLRRGGGSTVLTSVAWVLMVPTGIAGAQTPPDNAIPTDTTEPSVEVQDTPPPAAALEENAEAPPVDGGNLSETPSTMISPPEAGLADVEEPAPMTPVPPPEEANPSQAPDATAPATEDTAPDDLEEIVVTGSRIRTNPLDKPAPVLKLDREQLERVGLTSVADILQRLPVSGGALNTRFNSSGNFGFPPDGGGIGAGSAQADLRYLGPKRVLVLVDGVRWVNGSAASGVPSATDLNTIPFAIIERIEVLQDGASAIYGSDAIAGVINVITKKDFDGVEANAYFGGFSPGDGYTQQYDVSFGTNTENMSLFLSTSYVRQDKVRAADRDLARFPVPEIDRCSDNCSSGTPQGRFVLADPITGRNLDVTVNDGVGGVPRYDAQNPGGSADDFHTFTTADRFNFSPFNLVVTPSERLGVFGQVEYLLSDTFTFTGKALYNWRRSTNQAAPEPLFIGPDAGNGNRTDRISIDATNPFNPFGFTVDANTNSFFFGRRPLENGARIFRQNVNTFYLSGGFKGEFELLSQTFFWDVSTYMSQNRADQIKRGGFNAAKLQQAVGPIDGCRADVDGCVPFNFFGGQGADGNGTITPEMLDFVTFLQKDVSRQQLVGVVANLTGNLVELPGGMSAMALGVEHRRQEGFFRPDAVVTAGDSAGVPAGPTQGEFNVTEAYLEVDVPLLSDIPGFHRLGASGAVRLSDYSTFGSEETFKVGVRWRPIEDLLFRGNFAQGFRAPGIGELFGTEARFDQQLNDPCSRNSGASELVRANCRSRGIPDDYEQRNAQISVTTGGNRDLEPETSTSYTAGAVYSPQWARGKSWIDALDVEATFFWIELNDAIQTVNAQVQLDACARDPSSVYCQNILRNSNGTIIDFNSRLTNIGGLKTYGWDLSLAYTSPDTDFGRFRLTYLGNILSAFTEIIPAAEGFDQISREGTEVGDPEQAYPEFKSTVTLDWFIGELSAAWTVRYINAVVEQCRNLERDFPGLCSDPNPNDDTLSQNIMSSTAYNDVQLTWRPGALESRLGLTVGVNNLFNQDPPSCFSCALNGFDATTYDVPGVFGYIRAGYRM